MVEEGGSGGGDGDGVPGEDGKVVEGGDGCGVGIQVYMRRSSHKDFVRFCSKTEPTSHISVFAIQASISKNF